MVGRKQEKRKLPRYRVTEKVLLWVGGDKKNPGIHAELRSIGLGGGLVLVLGAYASGITRSDKVILTIIGDGPLLGLATTAVVVEKKPARFGAMNLNLAFISKIEDDKRVELEGDPRAIFMRWVKGHRALGKNMSMTSPPMLRS